MKVLMLVDITSEDAYTTAYHIALTQVALSVSEFAANFSPARPSNMISNTFHAWPAGSSALSSGSRSAGVRERTSVHEVNGTSRGDGFPCGVSHVTRMCVECNCAVQAIHIGGRPDPGMRDK